MTGNDIQAFALKIAAQLPKAELDYPFGEDIHVYKIMGKVFMLVFDLNGKESILEQNANKRIYKFISKHLWRFDIKTAKLSFPWKRMFEVKVDVSLNYANQSLLYKTKGW